MFKATSWGQNQEAVVLAVDMRRGVCKCKTVTGQMLTGVSWAKPLGMSKENGDNYGPLPGEIVMISHFGGEPIIQFSRSSVDSIDNTVRATLTGTQDPDSIFERYNLSKLKDHQRSEGSSPTTILPGDRVFTNDRGGILGLLRSGAAVIKASPLAQILVSKIDDLVRIVARNYEVFSDAKTHNETNVKGKIYSYTGHYRNQEGSLTNLPVYYEISGDVEVGVVARDNYASVDVDAITPGTTLKRQVVAQYDVDGEEITPRWVHTLTLSGESLRGSYNAGNTDSVAETVTNNTYTLLVTDASGNSSTFVSPASVVLQSQGTTLVQLNGASGEVLITSNTLVRVETETMEVDATTLDVKATTVNVTEATLVNVESTAVTVDATTVTITGLVNMN